MATNKIQFSGINRAVSDYSGTGACEELINLRPTETGLVPVKSFSVKMSQVSYNKVYEHNVGTQVNYIGIKESTNRIYFDLIDEDGERILNLFSVVVADDFSQDSIHIATSGNIITISISDDASGLYANYCFQWKNETYQPLEAKVPEITPTFSIGTPSLQVQEVESYWNEVYANLNGSTVVSRDEMNNKVNDCLSVGLNAIQTKNPTKCYGPVVVAIAFKTVDGDTFWTGQWFALNPVPEINSTSFPSTYLDDFHITTSSSHASDFPHALSYNGSAYALGLSYGSPGGASNRSYAYLAGAEITMTVPAISGWNKETSVLKSVEVYCSKPALYAEPGHLDSETQKYTVPSPVVNTTYFVTAFPEKEAKDMKLGGQLLYLQKSFDLGELTTDQSLTLKFGGNLQMTDKTLEVDPGMIVRTGKMLSYNNRYHFYDSNKRVFLGAPYFGYGLSPYTFSDRDVFVTYESDNIKKKAYIGTAKVSSSWNIVTAPTINIREIETIYHPNQAAAGQYYYQRYVLGPSTAYNYSIDDSGAFAEAGSRTEGQDADLDELLAIKALGITSFVDEVEATSINVSEQYNPFVFRPQHSYLAPAAILDLQPQLAKVADISIGNAPLDVFTARGVYALLQGDGTVLYGNMIALSNLVSTGNTAVTDTGTFFFASGSLWAMIGLKAVLVSDALSLGPHKEIRSCSGYQSLANASANTYDISSYESQPSFEEFTKEATITYNRFRDELIVSNMHYPYSYVLSLKYRQWFKIPQSLRQEVVGSDIAIVEDTTIVIPGTAGDALFCPTPDTFEDETITISIYTRPKPRRRSGSIPPIPWIPYATYTHTITIQEEEAVDADLQTGYDLIRDHIVSEWNSTGPGSEGIITAEAGSTPAGATHLRRITFTFNQRESDIYYLLGRVTASYDEFKEREFNFHTPYSIVDFSDEIESGNTTVHLQSRPLSYDYQYAHIHRIVDMVRTTLVYGQNNITVSLYGSDDLHTWKLLTYANRKSTDAQLPLHISQLRTPSSARSWRYYTIVLGGIIPIDTDFGPLLVDAQPVVRRIG